MTIREKDALGRQPINVRRLDLLCTVATEIPVAHVIRQDEYDIGWLMFGFCRQQYLW